MNTKILVKYLKENKCNKCTKDPFLFQLSTTNGIGEPDREVSVL